MMVECSLAREKEVTRGKDAKEDEGFIRTMRVLVGEGVE